MWMNILAVIGAFSALCLVASAEEVRFRRAFSEDCFKKYKNKRVKVAKPVKGVDSVMKCKLKCSGTDRCQGAQWDRKKKKCSIYVGDRVPRWKRTKGLDQYIKTVCTNNIMTTKLKDLTPGDGHRKTFYFEGFDELKWYLNVEPNTMLFGQHTAFQKRNLRGKVKGRGKVKSNCFYIGIADAGENEGGVAAVSTCEAGKGLHCAYVGLLRYDPATKHRQCCTFKISSTPDSKTRAYIQTPVGDYEINPFREYTDKKRSVRESIETLKEMIMKRGAVGANSSVFEYEHPMMKRGSRRPFELNKQLGQPNGKVLYLDLSCIVDTTFAGFMKSVVPGSGNKMFLHMAQLINFAQVWFLNPTLGYQIWVTMGRVIILTDPLTRNPEPRRRRQSYGLKNNCDWLPKVFKDSKTWDAVFILTESDFMTDGKGGLAITGGSCDPKNHCAAVKSQGLDVALLTRAITHETAHLLGMPDVYEPAPSSRFCYSGLMRSAQWNHDWSRCDTQSFEKHLSLKSAECLTRPKRQTKPNAKRPKFQSNVVWRGGAKQSSTYNGDEAKWGAWKAVDGSTASTKEPAVRSNPTLASCQRTNREKEPWLRVEVLPEYRATPIETIQIINRKEKADRLKYFEVRIGNNADISKNALCTERVSGLRPRREGSMLQIRCSKALSGRYISIQIKKDGILNVCEIFAFATVKLPNFKSPYKCQDAKTTCAVSRRKGQCKGDYKEIMIGRCDYTCGYCKRKSWKYKPKKTTTGGAATCADHADYCGDIKKAGHCGERSNIMLCPKTCGGGCTKKLPKE